MLASSAPFQDRVGAAEQDLQPGEQLVLFGHSSRSVDQGFSEVEGTKTSVALLLWRAPVVK